MASSPLQKISNSQKRRTRRLRMRRGSLNSQTSQISPTVTLSPTTPPPPPPPLQRMISTSRTYQPSTSKTSTSQTLTSQTSTSTSPSPTLKPTNPTNPQSPSTSLPLSPQQSASTRSRSSTSVDTADDPQDGSTTPDTLSNYDLDIDMLASRAFARDGAPAYPTTPPGLGLGLVSPHSTPRIIIDDYLEDVSLSSDSSTSNQSPSPSLSQARRLTQGSSSIDDHYELVVMPQLEIILDAVRAVQYEVNHLHNELLDLKVTTRHSLKKIWEYLNFSV
mgnify:CR=1 FL=1